MQWGPEYFEARRNAWLTPRKSQPPRDATASSPDSISHQRISQLLADPSAIESDDMWNRGLQTLWRGLISGSRFKKPLPLEIVIKILRAGWIRDGTWPAGVSLPDSPILSLPPPLPGHNGIMKLPIHKIQDNEVAVEEEGKEDEEENAKSSRHQQ